MAKDGGAADPLRNPRFQEPSVWQLFRDLSEAVRQLSNISWLSGQRQISWFISDAENVVMR